MNFKPTLLRLPGDEAEGNTNHQRVSDCVNLNEMTFQET
jgi:hypothetical protein